MSSIDLDPVYTPEEVAKYLRCSLGIVMSLVDRGVLKARVLTVGKKRMRRITRSALLEYISGADAEPQESEERSSTPKLARTDAVQLPRKRHFKPTKEVR